MVFLSSILYLFHSIPSNDGLPEELRRFTDNGPHHGSHPHLVNEFVMSIIEERKPLIDEYLAADVTACEICAHMSAMSGGKEILIPDFREEFK